MHKKLLEAALFMSPKPLNLNDLGKITGINSLGYLKDMLESLQKEYEESGLEIINTPEGWHMQVRQEFLSKVSHLTPYSDIPEGCKRTLAIVVYKEPVKQAEIIKIQGNKAYTYIKYLQKRGLIKIEKQGHSKILKVTKEFENYFGQDKEKIKELISQENSQE
ncbi:MAG: SMC-Scp complex subunit ScpB [Candidatus Aenigmatarchaeota archaeon]